MEYTGADLVPGGVLIYFICYDKNLSFLITVEESKRLLHALDSVLNPQVDECSAHKS